MSLPSLPFHVSGVTVEMPDDGTDRTVTITFSEAVSSAWTVVADGVVIGTGDDTTEITAVFPAESANGGTWALRHNGQERVSGPMVIRQLATGAPDIEDASFQLEDGGTTLAVTVSGSASGGNSYTVSDTAPTSPTEGDKWFDSGPDGGGEYTWIITDDVGAWVETGAEGLGTLLDDILATGIPSYLDLEESADVTNPAADHYRLIARTDGMYVRDPGGIEDGPLGSASTHPSIGWAPAVGRYCSTPGFASGATAAQANIAAAGAALASPFLIPPGTYDQIAVYITSTGVATLRLGLLAADSEGRPSSTVLLDAGTTTVASTGYAAVSTSLVVTEWTRAWSVVLVEALTSTFSLNACAWGFTNVGEPDSNGVPAGGLGSGGNLAGAIPASGLTTARLRAPHVYLRRSA